MATVGLDLVEARLSLFKLATAATSGCTDIAGIKSHGRSRARISELIRRARIGGLCHATHKGRARNVFIAIIFLGREVATRVK